MKRSAPRWAVALVRWAARTGRAEDTVGDLEEAHHKRVARWGPLGAYFLTALETADLLFALLRERWRDRHRAPLGPEPDETFHADRRRIFSLLDLKLALRMLIKYPGLTVIGGLGIMIAIAIGASFFDFLAVLSEDTLPLDEGDRIVSLENRNLETYNEQDPWLSDFVLWRDELTSVTTLSAYRNVVHNVFSTDGPAESTPMAEMTASGFDVARVPPLLGRTLQPGDEISGAPPVLVIGHDVWVARFAGDPDIIGRELRLGNTIYTIVGVMPQGFAFPIDHRYWVPFQFDPGSFEPGAGPLIAVFGRLTPGATLASARAELEAMGQTMSADHPQTHGLLRPNVIPFAHWQFDDDKGTVAFVHGLVVMILIVVCANVAILVYARTATRANELAVRTALGASRQRIVGQLFLEALVLSFGAAALGLLVTAKALSAVAASTANEGMRPFWWDFGLQPSTVAYALGLAAFGAVIVGALPGLQATARDVHATLQRSGTSRMQLGRAWTAMIVFQVAAAVTALPVATYFAWDLARHGLAEPGFHTEQFLSARLMLGESVVGSRRSVRSARDPSAEYAAHQVDLIQRLTADPRVTGVTYGLAVPGLEPGARLDVDVVPGGFEPTRSYSRLAWVDVGFFETFAVPVLAGRTFTVADLDSNAATVVVNESFVRDFLRGGNALGRLVRDAELRPDSSTTVSRAGLERDRWYEVVGVVPDFPNPMDPETATARVYRPLAPGQAGPVTLAIHVRGDDPLSFVPRLRELTLGIDPTLRLDYVRRLDLALSESQEVYRLTAIAIAGGMISLLLLSAAGIYALMSFTVTRRRREIGIRTALGADRSHLLLGVFRRAIFQLALGVVLGMMIVTAVEWYTSGELLRGTGPVLVPAVAGLMVLAGLAAAVGPARRGLEIEPTEALRSE